jgi:hypothetical protein
MPTPNTVRAILLSAADKIVQLANLVVNQDEPPAPEGHRWMRESGDANDIVWATGQDPVMGMQWDGNNPATFSVPPVEDALANMSDAELAQAARDATEAQTAIVDEMQRRLD